MKIKDLIKEFPELKNAMNCQFGFVDKNCDALCGKINYKWVSKLCCYECELWEIE